MKPKKCIVTGVSGNESILNETIPFMARYSINCGADFKVYNNSSHNRNLKEPQMMKLFVEDLLNEYSQVCWLDYDCLVNPLAPNIFEEVPEEKVGAWSDEHLVFEERPIYNHGYFNSGVLVLSHLHKGILKKAFSKDILSHYNFSEKELSQFFHEQTALNKIIHSHNIRVHNLNIKWNYLLEDELKEAYIIHFAGGKKVTQIDKNNGLELNIHPRAATIRRYIHQLKWGIQ